MTSSPWALKLSNPTDAMWQEVLDAAYTEFGRWDCLRFGQCLMIGLFQTYPKIYDMVAATEVDSFYDNEKVSKVKEAFYSIVEGGVHD